MPADTVRALDHWLAQHPLGDELNEIVVPVLLLTPRPTTSSNRWTASDRTLLRHQFEHPAESMCAVAFGVAGQLLLTWMLARAARSAEDVESPAAHRVPIPT